MPKLQTSVPIEFKKIGGSYYVPVPKAVLEFHGFNLEEAVNITLEQETAKPIVGAASAKAKSSGLIVQERKKSAPYRIQTGSEWFCESEPSNVQMLIDGYMPLFEKQQGTPILIEVEQ